MAKFYANPYSYELSGFFFTNLDEYNNRLEFAKKSQNSVDFEHEVEIIDATETERSIFELAKEEVKKFFELLEDLEDLDENQIIVLTHCVENLGYSFDKIYDNIESFEIWTDRDDLENDKTDQVFSGLDIKENDPIYTYFDAQRYVNDLLLNDEIVELNIDFYFTNPHFILN